jgi:large subunit ribosomal protein L9
MKVLFLKDVPGVAFGGDVKEVKSGYARNYLIPYHIAVLASSESLKQVEKIKVVSEKERIARMEDLQDVFESIKDLTVNIPMLSAQTGKLYGSVGHDMISNAIKESKGIELEERYIKLTESIKEHGIYNVLIEISDEMTTNLKIVIHDPDQNPDEITEEATEEATEEVTTEEATEEVTTEEATEEATEEVTTEEATEEVTTEEATTEEATEEATEEVTTEEVTTEATTEEATEEEETEEEETEEEAK